jgi:polyisoprenoid-binding protein YceI
MFKKLLIPAALALTLGTGAFAESYKIDTEGAHASINFKVSHLGYSFVIGRFDNFTGSFEFDAANPEAGSVNVEISTESVNTNHGKRDNHLRSADFLDAANNQTASFVSTGIKKTGDNTAIITGNLTISGITTPVDLDTVFVGEGKDPWGGYRAGFTATATINLDDYGMGGVIGKADVVLDIVAEGIRQ